MSKKIAEKKDDKAVQSKKITKQPKITEAKIKAKQPKTIIIKNAAQIEDEQARYAEEALQKAKALSEELQKREKEKGKKIALDMRKGPLATLDLAETGKIAFGPNKDSTQREYTEKDRLVDKQLDNIISKGTKAELALESLRNYVGEKNITILDEPEKNSYNNIKAPQKGESIIVIPHKDGVNYDMIHYINEKPQSLATSGDPSQSKLSVEFRQKIQLEALEGATSKLKAELTETRRHFIDRSQTANLGQMVAPTTPSVTKSADRSYIR